MSTEISAIIYSLVVCKPVPIFNTKQTPYCLNVCPKYKQITLKTFVKLCFY